MAKAKKFNNGGGIGRVSGLASGTGDTARHNLFLIDDETITDPRIRDLVFCPMIDGDIKGHGMKPRDYRIHPADMFDPPSDLHLISESEYDSRIEEQERTQSSLQHLLGWEATDQDGDGYCWVYSTTGAVQALRTLMNAPWVRLNPHSLGAIIKRGRNEGGWCGLSAKGLREIGVASFAFWKEHSRDLSQDNAACRANMALHKITEEWTDLTRDIYDQNLTLRQIDTCCLCNTPMAWDFNWWGHSVMGGRLVKVEAGSYGRCPRNSWGQQWGDKGWSVLRGSKAVPDGALAIRVTLPSVT